MELILAALVSLVALQHLGFLYLEMFRWETPRTRAIFGTSPEFAKASLPLAKNQGLYNGFLAAGLLWAAWEPDPSFSTALRVFFLACVITAALYAGYTTRNRKILLVQGLPAFLILGACIALA